MKENVLACHENNITMQTVLKIEKYQNIIYLYFEVKCESDMFL